MDKSNKAWIPKTHFWREKNLNLGGAWYGGFELKEWECYHSLCLVQDYYNKNSKIITHYMGILHTTHIREEC